MMNSPEQTAWKRGVYVALFAFALSLLYVIVRYHIVREVPFAELPLYTGNKAVALVSVILIGISLVLGSLARFFPSLSGAIPLRKPLGLIGFGAAGIHSLMSLALLSPAYYPKFFTEGGGYSFIGESAVLTGVLAFATFSVVAITSLPSVAAKMTPLGWKRAQRFGYLALVFTLVHVATPALQGWFNPGSYAYYLVPISLIASLFIVFVLLVRLVVSTLPRG